jgi:hypothetical protein
VAVWQYLFKNSILPPPKYEFAPQMPPQIPRPGAATEAIVSCALKKIWKVLSLVCNIL